MNTLYNFQTKTVTNPLDKITHFYVSPYQPDSQLMLNMKQILIEAQEKNLEVLVRSTGRGHIVCLFPIELLFKGNVTVKFTTEMKFTVNNNIYCDICGQDTSVIRIDTVNNYRSSAKSVKIEDIFSL